MERPNTSAGTSKARRPRHKRRPASLSVIPISPLGYEKSSRPDTPVEGLTPAEVRALRKLFDTGSKMFQAFQRVVQEYIGHSAQDDKLRECVRKVAFEKVSLFIDHI
jgi:hypothetical protein